MLLLVSACGYSPDPTRASLDYRGNRPGQDVVAVAKTLVGMPYQYGGATPDGFDCSGLVQYAYHEIGLQVPRTTNAQLQYAQTIRVANIRAGDVLFFRVSDRKVSHVGIYAGEGWFIHAPSRGGRVTYARMDNPFWQQRLVSAGRLY